ncbi:DUF47 domain-containing protein [Candidatus Nitrosocosmicus arcticus]|uniref:Putative phosphate transport regulator n=1 Tax=Candidatus Nitrosocosmicus arcticus TaxID=2035267 RepID=A0A557STA6_9ARCH|nr:DUF47 family protein [Candidatus Nitrosocosmicus arcticus]TVP39846.1 putative phosphate transport regulator [Candidatus Nitrosocosmicus arcticus]
MYSAELEVQTKRKTIAILQEEMNKFLNLSRELAIMTDAILHDNKVGIRESSQNMIIIENDIMMLRKQITREVISIGSLMTDREDLLRTAYFIDEISGYISGISFGLSNIEPKVITLNFELELKDMVDKIIKIIHKINEMSRTLASKPENGIELAGEVQRIEMEVDKRYRELTVKVLDQITSQNLIPFKDTIEGIGGMVDKCQQASNSFTILALSI